MAESTAKASEVAVPFRLDYPLLQQLLVSQLFTGNGQSRELAAWTAISGCLRPVVYTRLAEKVALILLIHPRVRPFLRKIDISAEL